MQQTRKGFVGALQLAAAAMFAAIGRFAADNPDCRVLVKERKSK